MFALNLQFFRLDDVIHFSWSRRLYRNRFVEWKKNSWFFVPVPTTPKEGVRSRVSQSRHW
jgi:hypothetical protein